MKDESPVVYVVQEPRYRDPADGSWKTVNMLPALDYGKLELLLESGRQTNVLNAAQVVRQLAQKLRDFRDRDFILAAGDPVAIGIACAIAVVVNRGKCTMLKWDRQEHKYYPVVIDLKEAM
jgi:hypothetical protein